MYAPSLVVRPISHKDIPQCIALRTATLGSLAIGHLPPHPTYISSSEASVHHDLAHNPHVHHLKVVDMTDEAQAQILAYAKWEVYPRGRSDLDKLRRPMEADKCVDEYGRLREAAHEYFCRCNGEMGKRGHICEDCVFELHRADSFLGEFVMLTEFVCKCWRCLSRRRGTDD